MDLKLIKALAGLRLIAASLHWSNSIDNNIDSYFEHENESETPIITLDDDDDDEDEDSRRPKGRTIKKPRLDNSTNKLKPNNQSHGKEKVEHNKFGETSNVQPETQTSSCLTILDDVEDSGFGENKKRKQIEEKEVRKKNLRLDHWKCGEKNSRHKESLEFLPPLSTNCQSETHQPINCSTYFNAVENSGFNEKKKRKWQKEIEANEVTKKNRKLDHSKNRDIIAREKSSELLSPATSTNSQPEIQAFSCLTHDEAFNTVEDSGFNEKKRKRQEKLTKKNATLDDSNNDSSKSETSSRSTYFSEPENVHYVTQLQQQGETECDTNSVQVPIQRTLRISIDNRKTLYYTRLLLETLESEFLVSDYIKTSRWIGTTVDEAVQAFVQIADNNADSTWAKEAAQICRTEAVKTLEIVYERIMKSLRSFESFRCTQWMYHFMILLTLCDSKSICKEFVKFLINQMITPESTSDLEDPKQIIEGLIGHNQARFGLIQLRNVLRKYATYVGEIDDQTNLCREMSPDLIVLWEDLRPNTTGFDSHLLNKLYKYAERVSSNFVVLYYITATNITLLKSRMSSEDSL